jgi:hypothetical protein
VIEEISITFLLVFSLSIDFRKQGENDDDYDDDMLNIS